MLCSKKKPTAWLLFHLAHELGHIVLGHVDTVPFLVDQEVERSDTDPEEAAANLFATELLTGLKEPWLPGKGLTGSVLAERSAAAGRAYRIDPGTVALNYGWLVRDRWGVVATALAMLEPSGDAPAVIRSKMAERLQWDKLPDESQDYLQRVTEAIRG